jgi:Lectin C-type domain
MALLYISVAEFHANVNVSSDFFVASRKFVRTIPMYYTDWLEPYEPSKDPTQSCVLVTANDERLGWNSDRCETRKPFICERSRNKNAAFKFLIIFAYEG